MAVKVGRHAPIMELTTASRLIARGPVWLLSVTIAGDGANADAQVYDGIDSSGEEKTHLEALSSTTFRLGLHYPVLFSKGLYVAVSAATTHLTVTYMPVDESEVRVEPWHDVTIIKDER